MHRYLYAAADPINKIDPSGKFGVFVVLGAAFVVLELIGVISARTREYGWCVIEDIERRSDECWNVVRDEGGDRRVIPESGVVGL